MADLIELEQQLFAHDFQSAHFLGVLFLGQVDLSIASLPDLCQNLEVALP
jgi:hypothetical protein